MEGLFNDYAGQRYHVLGIQIVDPELIFRTRKVIRCCFGLLAVLIIRTVVLLLLGESVATTILSILFNLSIPAFGYLGARDGNASLMCIFVALMTLNAANALAVLFIVAYAAATGLPQRGQDGSVHPFEMTVSVWTQVILISAWAAMALIASFHSNKLFSKLAQGDSIIETENPDAEIGMPQIDSKGDDDNIEPNSFGLPMNNSALYERDVDDELNSPVRRKRQTSQEMLKLSPIE